MAWLVALAIWLPTVPYWGLWLLVGYTAADAGSYLFHYVIDHYGDPAQIGLVREFHFITRSPGASPASG